MSEITIRQPQVETGLDVALENPLWIWLDQYCETLFNRIGTRPLLAKPIRVFCQQWFPARDRVPASAMPDGFDLSWWEFRAAASFCRPISGCKPVGEADTPSPRVLVPLLQVWVHCPRASNGPLPRRSNLVGYVQWDARFDRILLCQTIISSSFSGRSLLSAAVQRRHFQWEFISSQKYRGLILRFSGLTADHSALLI
jgi:hypothetical protein